MVVVGATCLVNLALAQVFQAHAHVAGVSSVPTLAIVLDILCWVAAWAMLRQRPRAVAVPMGQPGKPTTSR